MYDDRAKFVAFTDEELRYIEHSVKKQTDLPFNVHPQVRDRILKLITFEWSMRKKVRSEIGP